MSAGPPEQRQRPKTVSELLEELGPLTKTQHDEMSLIPQRSSLTMTIMADAWKDANIDLNDPGTADQYYYRDEGVVLIDLEGRFRNE